MGRLQPRRSFDNASTSRPVPQGPALPDTAHRSMDQPQFPRNPKPTEIPDIFVIAACRHGKVVLAQAASNHATAKNLRASVQIAAGAKPAFPAMARKLSSVYLQEISVLTASPSANRMSRPAIVTCWRLRETRYISIRRACTL